MSLYLVGGKPINGDLAVFVAITIKQKREKGGGGGFLLGIYLFADTGRELINGGVYNRISRCISVAIIILHFS